MKYISGLLGIITGGLVFLFFSLTCFSDLSGNYTGWDFLSLNTDASGRLLFKIFGIVALVLAGLSIFLSIFLLLDDCGVIRVKSKLNFHVANNALLTLFLFSVVMAFIGLIIFQSNYELTKASIGVGMWLTLFVSLATCLLAWMFGSNASTKRHRRR